MPHHRRTSAENADRRRQAVELRLDGMSYEAIADRLGWRSHSSAHAAVQDGLQDAIREPAESLIRLELLRLDELHRACWGKAMAGDLRAVDRVLRVMERRARLLGLDKPAAVAVDVSHVDDLDAQISALVAELSGENGDTGSRQ